MGKKTRKTRWRTLAITSGDQSDSEESNSQSGHQPAAKSHPPKPFYSKFPYSSSQSTPVRNRFQNDSKSTRSSSTTSENKITFNEDEYTKITTPRQDVLFKKGYLSKPKTYQTQTSTGNSTISTGNSTGNGTPDHQSADGTEGTDLEYESQFVFPNGYVDHNGIYYINSFEPYPPLVVYNAPYCYPEYPITRSKRYSTDSLTESTSPNNEETSQDQSQSGGETFGVSEEAAKTLVNGHHCEDGEVETTQDCETAEQRKVKKRRRRKLSKPIPDDGTTSEDSDTRIQDEQQEEKEVKKIELKPDAKEFIPRAYQNPTYVPNFIPLPLISELHPAFLPPGIPVNFMHNYVNFIPNYVPNNNNQKIHEVQQEHVQGEVEVKPEIKEEVQNYKNNIDIEKIVYKLEEAAKEQRFYENRKQKFSPHHKYSQSKTYAKKPPRRSEEPAKPEICSKPNYAEVTVLKKNTNPEKPVVTNFVEAAKPKVNNEWISVSRKKRNKNKTSTEEPEIEENLNDSEAKTETIQTIEEDAFETYDVNELKDVVVPKTEPESPVKKNEENEGVKTEEDCDEIEKLIRSLEEIEAKTNLLKKRNKSTKNRRVIITDVDVRQNLKNDDALRSPVKIIKQKDNDTNTIAKDDFKINEDEITNNKEEIENKKEEIANNKEEIKNKKEEIVNNKEGIKNKKKEIVNIKEEIKNKKEEIVNNKEEIKNKKEELVNNNEEIKPIFKTKEEMKNNKVETLNTKHEIKNNKLETSNTKEETVCEERNENIKEETDCKERNENIKEENKTMEEENKESVQLNGGFNAKEETNIDVSENTESAKKNNKISVKANFTKKSNSEDILKVGNNKNAEGVSKIEENILKNEVSHSSCEIINKNVEMKKIKDFPVKMDEKINNVEEIARKTSEELQSNQRNLDSNGDASITKSESEENKINNTISVDDVKKSASNTSLDKLKKNVSTEKTKKQSVAETAKIVKKNASTVKNGQQIKNASQKDDCAGMKKSSSNASLKNATQLDNCAMKKSASNASLKNGTQVDICGMKKSSSNASIKSDESGSMKKSSSNGDVFATKKSSSNGDVFATKKSSSNGDVFATKKSSSNGTQKLLKNGTETASINSLVNAESEKNSRDSEDKHARNGYSVEKQLMNGNSREISVNRDKKLSNGKMSVAEDQLKNSTQKNEFASNIGCNNKSKSYYSNNLNKTSVINEDNKQQSKIMSMLNEDNSLKTHKPLILREDSVKETQKLFNDDKKQETPKTPILNEYSKEAKKSSKPIEEIYKNLKKNGLDDAFKPPNGLKSTQECKRGVKSEEVSSEVIFEENGRKYYASDFAAKDDEDNGFISVSRQRKQKQQRKNVQAGEERKQNGRVEERTQNVKGENGRIEERTQNIRGENGRIEERTQNIRGENGRIEERTQNTRGENGKIEERTQNSRVEERTQNIKVENSRVEENGLVEERTLNGRVEERSQNENNRIEERTQNGRVEESTRNEEKSKRGVSGERFNEAPKENRRNGIEENNESSVKKGAAKRIDSSERKRLNNSQERQAEINSKTRTRGNNSEERQEDSKNRKRINNTEERENVSNSEIRKQTKNDVNNYEERNSASNCEERKQVCEEGKIVHGETKRVNGFEERKHKTSPQRRNQKSEEKVVEANINNDNPQQNLIVKEENGLSSSSEKVVTAEDVNSKLNKDQGEEIDVKKLERQLSSETETPEKKRAAKKKKKPAKTKAVPKNFDQTYDFLLNSTFQETEKTNIEISEELSKIIQRGMYSSLEEKIKSLNITAVNDGFFKTINIFEPAEKKSDLTNVANTSSIFRKPRRSVEDLDLINFPSVSGSFLDLSNSQKDPGRRSEEKEETKEKSYPITQAVKDWMTKTRETTPEVEILKSPSTILKQVLKKEDLEKEEEDDVVVFSKDWSLTPETSFEEDLLEWDDEIEMKKADEKVEAAEDVLEVYESKYGKNEDYEKIKEEVKEKKINRTFPKHQNLPYRAICCSLM